MIEPLPALPKAWASGHFDGLVARGNFKVSAEWSDGQLTALGIHSRAGNECRLRHPALAGATVLDEVGAPVELLPGEEGELRFATEIGGRYVIQK